VSADGGCAFRYRSGNCAWGYRPDRIAPDFSGLLPAGHPSVLDVGCGEGRNSVWLASKGASVQAIDIDAEILGRGDPRWREAEGICWEGGDIRTIRLTPMSYDGVLACNVLQWLLDADDVARVVSRLQSVTRPGGLNGIVVFNDRWPYPEAGASRPPVLLPHQWYLDRYEAWEVLRESDTDSTHTHPGETAEHTHGITRLILRRPIALASPPKPAAEARK